jgi:hypothetical protein
LRHGKVWEMSASEHPSVTDPDLVAILSRIHHVTSVSVATEMLRTGMIWGNDGDRAANFHPNRSSKSELPEPKEVALEFWWTGEHRLVSQSTPSIDTCMPGILYHWICSPAYSATKENLCVLLSKLLPGTKNGLTCVAVHPLALGEDQASIDQAFADDLKALSLEALIGRSMWVPPVRRGA